MFWKFEMQTVFQPLTLTYLNIAIGDRYKIGNELKAVRNSLKNIRYEHFVANIFGEN